MSTQIATLPTPGGNLFLTDAGLETDLIFNRGVPIREFAAHTLLETGAGRQALAVYFREFLSLARLHGVGFVLDAPTWKAHPHWANDLGVSPASLRDVNRAAVDFVADLREEFMHSRCPIVLNAVIGPRGDAYLPEEAISAAEAEAYHAQQLGWLARTDVQMVSALTFTNASEALGFVRAANRFDLPTVMSFTVETDGKLPSGESLAEAIQLVDQGSDGGPRYYMLNCAHPSHFRHVLNDEDWTRRLGGIRCNASRCSHAELDNAEQLDRGDPQELASAYTELLSDMPWLSVFGGCCGSDIEHVTAIAASLRGRTDLSAGSEA